MRILVTKTGRLIFTGTDVKSFDIGSGINRYKPIMRKYTIDKYKTNKTLHSNNANTNSQKSLDFNITTRAKKNNLSLNTEDYKLPDKHYSRTSNNFYSLNNQSPSNIIGIKLKQKLYKFPEKMQSKYESYKTSNTNNDKLQEILGEKSKSELPVIEEDSKKENYNYKWSLAEILGDKLCYKLKKEVSNKEKMRDKLSVVDSRNFRTDYSKLPDVCKLKEILDYKKIKGDKNELIKYLKMKNEVTPLFLKNLVTSNQYEIFKADKLSQTQLVKEEKDKVLQTEIQMKIKSFHINNKLIGHNHLKFMKDNLTEENNIFEKYKIRPDKKLKYLDKHQEIKKGWVKYNLNNLENKKYMFDRNKMSETNTIFG